MSDSEWYQHLEGGAWGREVDGCSLHVRYDRERHGWFPDATRTFDDFPGVERRSSPYGFADLDEAKRAAEWYARQCVALRNVEDLATLKRALASLAPLCTSTRDGCLAYATHRVVRTWEAGGERVYGPFCEYHAVDALDDVPSKQRPAWRSEELPHAAAVRLLGGGR